MSRPRHPLTGKHDATLVLENGRWYAEVEENGRALIDATSLPEDAVHGDTARVRIKTIEGQPVARIMPRRLPILHLGGREDKDPILEASELDHAEVSEDCIERYIAAPSDVIQAMDRVAVFIDAANFNASRRELRLTVNYAKLLSFLVGPGRLVTAFYYVIAPDAEYPSSIRFMDLLGYQGYTPRLKKPKHMRDHDTGKVVVKANVDSEIIVDMMATHPTWDVAWLLSGDGDFEPVVIHLRGLGKRVYVMAGDRAMSRELAFNAHPPVFKLEDHASAFQEDSRKRSPATHSQPF